MPGTLIAEKYELLGEVGRGSLGTVFKARDPDGRIVALKVIDGVAGDDVKVKRFQQGIQAARLLNHPNIACASDSGLINSANPFYVMEFVEGKLLSHVLAESGRMQLARVLRIAAQICDAIDHAHYYGVIHRNLKPANIMLVQQPDGTEMVKVLDFGLAKSFFQSGKPGQALTAAGEVIGAPEYMSPEQCMQKDVDWRSDIYSAGCLFFELLTGATPVKGMNMLDTLMKQARDKPRSFAEVAGDASVPDTVQTVIMQALQKDPNLRQQTMIQLKEELQTAGDSVSNTDTALESLRKGAQAGDREAQFALASHLERMNTTQNVAEIADWFRKAADQGHLDAQFRMGQAYELGLGVKRDSERAVHYYRKAGEQGREEAKLRALQIAAFEGDVDAQVNLALCFKTGMLVPQNFAEAEKWFGKAAEKRFGDSNRFEQVMEFAYTLANRDHPEGLYWLGILYKDGKGSPPDPKQASKWLIKAADLGHTKAAEELKEIPVHIVDEVRRGRPRWDKRQTITPFSLSPESKKLIEAVKHLKKKDSLKHRYDLYEAFRESTVLVAYEDAALTKIAGTVDSDERIGAAVFTEFAALNRWQQPTNRVMPWAEKRAQEICLQLKQIPDSSLVLDGDENSGITLRHWELDALAANAYPVTRGDFMTELELEPGMMSSSRVPRRPSEEFLESVRRTLQVEPWIKGGYMLEAVFEPVRRPAEMTIVVHISKQKVSQDDLKRVGDRLRDLLSNNLRARYSRVLFTPDSPCIHPLRRASICIDQRI